MEKVIKQLGASLYIRIDKGDREYFNLEAGDRITFTITNVIKKESIVSEEDKVELE